MTLVTGMSLMKSEFAVMKLVTDVSVGQNLVGVFVGQFRDDELATMNLAEEFAERFLAVELVEQ